MSWRHAGAAILLLATATPCFPVLDLRLEVGSISRKDLADPIRQVSVSCRLEPAPAPPAHSALRCSDGRAAARWREQSLDAAFSASLAATGAWQLELTSLRAPALSMAGAFSGRASAIDAKLSAGVSDLTAWPALVAAIAPTLPRFDLAGSLDVRMSLQRRGGSGSSEGELRLSALTLSEASGRYAGEQLGARLGWNGRWTAQTAEAQLEAEARAGQAYAEPVFLDLSAAPIRASAKLRLDRQNNQLEVQDLQLDQAGVVHLAGGISKPRAAPPDAELHVSGLRLGPAFDTYIQPFLAGTRFEKLGLSGQASGEILVRAGKPSALDLGIEEAGIDAPAFSAALSGLEGRLTWSDLPAANPLSVLRWTGGRIARLDLGGSELRFVAQGRDFTLQAPALRIPLAGGALKVNQLALRNAGQPDISAHFDAEIEPIDLAALTRALGWPVFGGTLSGRLPGLRLQDRELSLDGALRAQAFDGEISVDGLRAIDPLGRVPRLLASIHLRGLDLAALTGAFSFGRIEGRLDGDVENLRLVNWQPVAFAARLATPSGDRSRKRISQRAIDNISSIGGGPTGVLSRGALRFFEDFAYARIGWSCVLRDGVCHMDGVEPAKGGGYVLVQGRLLPRIDVVGFQREVDWNTFLSQLKSASAAQGVEVR